MKYETPTVLASTSAIGAIQATPPEKNIPPHMEGSGSVYELTSAYEDWE